MTSLSLRQQRLAGAPGISAVRERIGFWFAILLVWLFFEFGRPPLPLKIPLVISLVSLGGWLVRRNKQWAVQSWGYPAFVGLMALGIPMAPNTFSVFFNTRNMAVLFFSACLPLQSLLTSVGRVRLWTYAFLGIAVYVGLWAAFHGGMGPSAASGGQDENYVAALMGMAIPFGYFSLFAEKRMAVRVLLASSLVVFVSAIALGGNPSRGGFIGLCAVALYCLARSPRKLLGSGLFIVIAGSLVALAGPAFWQEIRTSTDFQTGTADIRIEIWKIGLRMWRANPLFGVGSGNFPWVIGDYQSQEQFAKFGRNLSGSIVAHSLPVELLAELGITGAIVLAAMVWRTWADLGRVRQACSEEPRLRPLGADAVQLRCYADAARASILAILVNGVFLSLLYFSHLWLLIALGTAIPIIYRTRVAEAGAELGLPREAKARRSAVGAGVGWRSAPWRSRSPPRGGS